MDAAQLHRLARLLREMALDATKDDQEQVSPSELAVVEDVAHHPGSAIGEIAGRTGLAQSLVSRVVAGMREAGVFTTEVDPLDRRRMRVSIESEMRLGVFRERGGRSIEAALRRALPDAAADDLRGITELLDQLFERLKGAQ